MDLRSRACHRALSTAAARGGSAECQGRCIGCRAMLGLSPVPAGAAAGWTPEPGHGPGITTAPLLITRLKLDGAPWGCLHSLAGWEAELLKANPVGTQIQAASALVWELLILHARQEYKVAAQSPSKSLSSPCRAAPALGGPARVPAAGSPGSCGILFLLPKICPWVGCADPQGSKAPWAGAAVPGGAAPGAASILPSTRLSGDPAGRALCLAKLGHAVNLSDAADRAKNTSRAERFSSSCEGPWPRRVGLWP